MIGNRLLELFPQDSRDRLTPRLHPFEFACGALLHETARPVEHVCFPVTGVGSVITVFNDNEEVEVAMIGSEGAVGVDAALDDGHSPFRVIVQGAGQSLRIETAALRAEAEANPGVMHVLHRYSQVLLSNIAQSAACNAVHRIEQRCARWLLTFRDRVGMQRLAVTHEMLARMLAVRRPSITEITGRLDSAGLIRHGRGEITIINRAGLEALACECYGRTHHEYRRIMGVG